MQAPAEPLGPSLAAARLAILGAAVLWSLGGAFIKVLTGEPGQEGLSASGIVFYRSLFAACALVPLLLTRRRGRCPAPLDLAVSVLLYAVLLGLYVASTQGTTAANAIFLQYTAPVYVVALSPFLLREPWRGSDLITLAAAGVGIAILAGGGWAESSARPALLMGAASGLCFGLFLLWLRRMRSAEPLRLTLLNNVGVAVIFAAALALTEPVELGLPLRALEGDPSSLRTLGLLALMGVVQIAAPYVLFSTGLRRVRSVEASFLTLVEPVLNPLWVLLAVSERPSGRTLAGGGLIIAALLFRYARKDPGSAPEDGENV